MALVIKSFVKDTDIKQGAVKVATAAAIIAILCLIVSCITIVPSGHVGVPVIFGKVQEYCVEEGMHFVNPFASVKKMSIRTETYTMSAVISEGQVQGNDAITALSSDGLMMPMDISIPFRLVGKNAWWVYRNLGTHDDYIDIIVRSAGRTSVREATAGFTGMECYSTKRDSLALEMEKRLNIKVDELLSRDTKSNSTYFIFDQIMIRNVQLPEKVKTAIEEKLEAEQAAQKMTFVLQKETQEADRKRVEARGIADANAIIAKSLTQEYLTWNYIETMGAVIKSPNNSTLIMPFDQKLVPMLNVGK